MSSTEAISKKIVLFVFGIFGIFQIVAYPFLLIQGNFTVLCIIYTMIMAAIIIIAVKKNSERILKLLSSRIKASRLTLGKGVFIALADVQIFSYAVLKHSDADDNFYAAIPNLCISSDTVLGCEPSMGMEYNEYPSTYRMVGYEVFVGYLSKVTQVNSSTLFHTILPMFNIGLYYMIQYLIGRKIFKDKWAYYGILISVLNIFGGYAVYSTGSFLLLRLGQGKAVMCNSVFSYMLYMFLCQYGEDKISVREIIKWIIVLFAGVGVSTVGVYLVPIFYGANVLGWLVYKRKEGLKRLFNNFGRFCIPVLCILPVVIAVLALLSAANNLAEPPADNIDVFEIGKMVQGSSEIWLIFAVSAIVILAVGSKTVKMLLIVPGIVLAVTVLNPFLDKYVARYITGISVYWRVFWLIPVYIVIAVAGAYITVGIKHRVKLRVVPDIIFIVFLIIIAHNGVFIYSNSNYSVAEDKCKINTEVMETANSIIADGGEAVLLADEKIWLEIRQYTGEIKLIKSRYLKNANKYYDEIESLYYKLYSEKTAGNKEIEYISDLCGMNYLMIYKTNYSVLNDKYRIVYEGTDYYIVKVE